MEVERRIVPKGTSLREVPGDGSCFYHALALGLSALYRRRKFSSAQIRAEAIGHMQKHPDTYGPLWNHRAPDEQPLDDFSRYCELAAQPTAWATHLEVLAAARHFDTAIVVVPACPSIPVGVARSTAPRRVALFWTGGHFAWLEPTGDTLPPELLRAATPLTQLCCVRPLTGGAISSRASRARSRSASTPSGLATRWSSSLSASPLPATRWTSSLSAGLAPSASTRPDADSLVPASVWSVSEDVLPDCTGDNSRRHWPRYSSHVGFRGASQYVEHLVPSQQQLRQSQHDALYGEHCVGSSGGFVQQQSSRQHALYGVQLGSSGGLVQQQQPSQQQRQQDALYGVHFAQQQQSPQQQRQPDVLHGLHSEHSVGNSGGFVQQQQQPPQQQLQHDVWHSPQYLLQRQHDVLHGPHDALYGEHSVGSSGGLVQQQQQQSPQQQRHHDFLHSDALYGSLLS